MHSAHPSCSTLETSKMLYSSMKYGSCAPIWLDIRKRRTARGRFLKTST